MATTKVAEGPLIKHIPGGYAEFRARESGLPPARLVNPEGEWWGKLVDAPVEQPFKPEPPVTQDPPEDDEGSDEQQGLDDVSYANKLREELNRADTTAEPVKIGPYESIDWDVPTGIYGGKREPQYGPFQEDDPRYRTDDFRFYEHPGVRGTEINPPVSPRQPLVPPPIQSPQEPKVIYHPPKSEDRDPVAKGEKPFRFYEYTGPNPSDAVLGVLKGVESMGDAMLGPTELGQYPRPEKEKEVVRIGQKIKEWFNGIGEEKFLLWETNEFGVGPKYGKTLANLGRIIKNEDKIEIQEMGDLQWLAIINAANLVNTYGPLGAALPAIATIAKDMSNAMADAFAEHPNMKGNPIQDAIYGTTWIAGKAIQKSYNNTLGKILPKIGSGNLKDKLKNSKLFDFTADPTPSRLKITIGPPKRPKETQEYERADHDPIALEKAEQQTGKQVRASDKQGEAESVVGRQASPTQIQRAEEQQVTETSEDKPPIQKSELPLEDAKTLTIVPTPPPPPVDSDQLTQEELDAKPTIKYKGPPITPPEAAEIAEGIIGEMPQGQKRAEGTKPYEGKSPESSREWTDKEREEFEKSQKDREKQKQKEQQEEERQEFIRKETELPPKIQPPLGEAKTLGDPTGEFPKGKPPEIDQLTEDQLEGKPDITQLEEDLPEIKPDTLEELKKLGIEPAEDPTEPYATYTAAVKVPVRKDGSIIDPNDPLQMEEYDRMIMLPMEFPARGKDDPKADSEISQYSIRMDNIELEQQIKKEDEEWKKQQQQGTNTGQTTGGEDDPLWMGGSWGRTKEEEELGLSQGGFGWESDEWRTKLDKIETQPGWLDSHITGKRYNYRLPKSADPDHPNYEGNFPDHYSNDPGSVYVSPITPKEDPNTWAVTDPRVEEAAERAGKRYREEVVYTNLEGQEMRVLLPVRIFKDQFGFSYGIDYSEAGAYGVPIGWQPRYIQGRVSFTPGE